MQTVSAQRTPSRAAFTDCHRYYRFTVSKPLSITTKMNNVAGAVILRTTIVNESGFPFFFEKISFVAQPPYTCTHHQHVQADDSAVGGSMIDYRQHFPALVQT